MSDERYIPLTETEATEFNGECLNDAAVSKWLTTMPAQLDDDALIFRLRNRVYQLPDPRDAGAAQLCVKAFKAAGRLRSLSYRRTGSKAQRAHTNARHLYHAGAGAAEPLGYMDKWQQGRLCESYLISGLLDQATDLYTEMHFLLQHAPVASHFVALMRVAAQAIRAMHDSGFVHNDLGAQNILMQRIDPGHWENLRFIDLNRGQILPDVSLRLRARDMARLQIPSHYLGILYQIYFDDGPVPAEFQRWEAHYRRLIRWRQASRKYRHPIRHLRHSWQLRQHGKGHNIEVSAGKLQEQDLWLWDDYSSQPSVTMKSKDRRRYRRTGDFIQIFRAFLASTPGIYRAYRHRQTHAYQAPVVMAGRLGVTVEADHTAEEQLAALAAVPGMSVLVRCYFQHHDLDNSNNLAIDIIHRLHQQGHEVAMALVQSRHAITHPEQWQRFITKVITRVQGVIHFVEVGHAVNRAKWGFWTLDEMNSVWRGVPELKRKFPHLTFLGPAVNDFEFHYYPALLNKTGAAIDGISSHLYVDRRGAPENYQGHFSSLEKCLAGKAIADRYGKAGFYITEINWPLRDTGLHSPLAGAYIQNGATESPLHVSAATSAAYMIRFALIALCSGSTERIWWWRLAHPGFGLFDTAKGFAPRPGWHALVHFHHTLKGEEFQQREEKDGVIWWHFRHCCLAYALAPANTEVPGKTQAITTMTGSVLPLPDTRTLTIDGEPVYFHYR